MAGMLYIRNSNSPILMKYELLSISIIEQIQSVFCIPIRNFAIGMGLHESCCIVGRKNGPPSGVVQRVQQGASHFIKP